MQTRFATGLLGGMLCLASVQAQPAAPEPLPSPLTLERALRIADEAHPDIVLAQARMELRQAQADAARAQTGVEISGQLLPQYVQPADPAVGPQTADNQAHLYITKRLYDFGASRTSREAAGYRVASSRLGFLDVRQQRRLEIMRRFFDVLLADLRYMVDNEAMAHAYVIYDRVRERHSLGRISDVDLAESETRYQEFLVKRTRSQIEQRTSRQRLANALNRPGELAGKLARPALKGNDRPVPEFETLLKRVQQNNPALLRLRKEVAAAESALAAVRNKHKPTLDAEFQASYYDRALGLRDTWRAALNFRVPIYSGGRTDAEVAETDARLHNKRAELKKAEYDLRQQVLDLVQKLELLKVDRTTAKTRSNYRDLYLDRSRALYEMEAEVSLGDAMTRLTEAQWKAARVEFELAMTWARIDALRGTLIAAAEAK
jgi:outer membrane protein TolC